jgi:hypothetical protein
MRAAFKLDKSPHYLAPAQDIRRNLRALCFQPQTALALKFSGCVKVGNKLQDELLSTSTFLNGVRFYQVYNSSNTFWTARLSR